MEVQEIIIGRDPACDITLGSVCKFASKRHACIYKDGPRYMLRDFSTNGTWVNGVRIRNRVIPINRGDNILIAGQYKISWTEIDAFLRTDSSRIPQSTLYYSQQDVAYNSLEKKPLEPSYKWNWGAFSLYPLWGFWNGCWWGIIVSLFFGWLWPIPNIVFGIYGSDWAWHNRRWSSVEKFNSIQNAWKPWGIAFFIINVVSIYFVWSFWFALLFGISMISY